MRAPVHLRGARAWPWPCCTPCERAGGWLGRSCRPGSGGSCGPPRRQADPGHHRCRRRAPRSSPCGRERTSRHRTAARWWACPACAATVSWGPGGRGPSRAVRSCSLVGSRGCALDSRPSSHPVSDRLALLQGSLWSERQRAAGSRASRLSILGIVVLVGIGDVEAVATTAAERGVDAKAVLSLHVGRAGHSLGHEESLAAVLGPAGAASHQDPWPRSATTLRRS